MSKSKLEQLMSLLDDIAPFDVHETLQQVDDARTDKPDCIYRGKPKRGKKK